MRQRVCVLLDCRSDHHQQKEQDLTGRAAGSRQVTAGEPGMSSGCVCEDGRAGVRQVRPREWPLCVLTRHGEVLTAR